MTELPDEAPRRREIPITCSNCRQPWSADHPQTCPAMPPPASPVLEVPVIVTSQEAARDAQREALVLVGDLCELARLLVARLKETTLQAQGVDDLRTIAAGLTEIERALVQAKAAVEIGTACAGV